jgi:hypothetical protein
MGCTHAALAEEGCAAGTALPVAHAHAIIAWVLACKAGLRRCVQESLLRCLPLLLVSLQLLIELEQADGLERIANCRRGSGTSNSGQNEQQEVQGLVRQE